MAAYYNNDTILYLNGQYVKATEAKMDFYSQSLHYGYSVFEGIRSYKTASGATRIFKAEAHFERLQQSAAALNMPFHWTVAELVAATYETLHRNHLQDAYIRPVVYAPANMSFVKNEQSFIVIETWEMQPFLGKQLLRVMTSSFQRPNPKAFHIHAKAAGHYVNSLLASQEAKANGYDEALLLDMHGFVAEAPGANLFFEKDGRLFTPALGNILPGITRATVLELCSGLGIEAIEQSCTREALAAADAAFFCGTAAEIVGIKSIDDHEFPLPWQQTVSCRLQEAYHMKVTEQQYQQEQALV